MENNILQNLISALDSTGRSQEQSTPQVPLYPAEAYPATQPQQSQPSQNSLLPLILSLFGQNANSAELGNMLSGQGELSSVLSLISSLQKKKDDKKAEKKDAAFFRDGSLPKNELL